MQEEYEDISVKCKICHKWFIFTAGEAAFYADRALTIPPRRCPACRKKSREEREARLESQEHPQGGESWP